MLKFLTVDLLSAQVNIEPMLFAKGAFGKRVYSIGVHLSIRLKSRLKDGRKFSSNRASKCHIDTRPVLFMDCVGVGRQSVVARLMEVSVPAASPTNTCSHCSKNRRDEPWTGTVKGSTYDKCILPLTSHGRRSVSTLTSQYNVTCNWLTSFFITAARSTNLLRHSKL